MEIIETILEGIQKSVPLQMALALIALLLLYKVVFRKFNRHKANRRKAKNVLVKIQSFEHAGKIFSYLRKIDPFVFEELLLTAFERVGYRAIRNKKYTGDGGIDGRLINDNGDLILVQAKRYSNYINNAHVQDFARIVNKDRRASKGYFVHTGKTGSRSHEILSTSNDIELFSGKKLIELIRRKSHE